MDFAEQKGYQIGEEKGRKALLDAARELKKIGITNDVLVASMKLSLEEVENV